MNSIVLKEELIQEINDRKIDNLIDELAEAFPGTTFYKRWEKGTMVKIPGKHSFSMIVDSWGGDNHLVETWGHVRGDIIRNRGNYHQRDDEWDFLDEDDGIRVYDDMDEFIYAIHMYFM